MTDIVRIVTTHFSRADFIEYQIASIKKFVQDKYEFIVINDALETSSKDNFFNKNVRTEISQMCSKYGIRCINFPNELHSQRKRIYSPWEDTISVIPAARCADVIQYGLVNFGFNHKGIYVILDGDMVFIDNISFKDILKRHNANIIAVPQCRGDHAMYYEYFWNGIVVLDIPNLPHITELNFNCGLPTKRWIEGDTGAWTTLYLGNYASSLKWYKIADGYNTINKTLTYVETLPDYLTATLKKLYEDYKKEKRTDVIPLGNTLLENKIYHYGAGSNWTGYKGDNPIILYKNNVIKAIYEYCKK